MTIVHPNVVSVVNPVVNVTSVLLGPQGPPGPPTGVLETHIITATQALVVPPWATFAEIVLVGGGAGGGGGGSAALTGGITGQAGGVGGAAGGEYHVILPVTPGATATVTIGAGGAGGVGGIASTGATGVGGGNGGSGGGTSVNITGQGVVGVSNGGSVGRGAGPNNAAGAALAIKGWASAGSVGTINTSLSPGQGGWQQGSSGTNYTTPSGVYAAGGGTGGFAATATLGGNGGIAGTVGQSAVNYAAMATFTGGNGTSGAPNSGAGGAGGGGGAPGGAGGNGGNGGSGFAYLTWRGTPSTALQVDSMYVPWSLNYYGNPLALSSVQSTGTLNTLYLYSMLSGPTPITIDKLDTWVNTAGVGTAVRLGLYQITNQATPFAWKTATKWADLLIELGTIPTTATGQQVLTSNLPYTIPAMTWFAIAGVEQGTTAATRWRWQRGVGVGSGPLGYTGAYSANQTAASCLYVNGISGALPTAFTPGGPSGIDCGIGIHRSA